MVFESLLVDILNIYLKPYVKKIDSSNLNIGVWNGKLSLATPSGAFKRRLGPTALRIVPASCVPICR